MIPTIKIKFIETSHFTAEVKRLSSEDDYYKFQDHLVARPDVGVIIPGSGGLRKVRFAAKGHGKRGGVRIIYYWAAARDTILLLDIFPKNEKADLTKEELDELSGIVSEEFYE
jgi:mRNA-degrading endonuclease RelE of RelBE toxin-antitoxin system